MKKFHNVDEYIQDRNAEIQEVLLFLRKFILQFDENITETFKYNGPFYLYKDTLLCYLHNTKGKIYFGFPHHKNKLKHPALKSEGRTWVKVYYIDYSADIDVKELGAVLKTAVAAADKISKEKKK